MSPGESTTRPEDGPAGGKEQDAFVRQQRLCSGRLRWGNRSPLQRLKRRLLRRGSNNWAGRSDRPDEGEWCSPIPSWPGKSPDPRSGSG